jgi:hypothetical protein
MVEALGEAWQLGWQVTARCAYGKRDVMKSVRACIYSYELASSALVWTRGAPFPLSDLARCPKDLLSMRGKAGSLPRFGDRQENGRLDIDGHRESPDRESGIDVH